MYTKILGIDKSLPKLLALVGIRAATISQVEPIAIELPWLFKDLMNFVNQSKYRRIDNKGNVVLVKTMRVGLNFFDLENLMVIITSLARSRISQTVMRARWNNGVESHDGAGVYNAAVSRWAPLTGHPNTLRCLLGQKDSQSI